MKHDIKKQPKWVQREFQALNEKCQSLEDDLSRLRKAHALLEDTEWFTLHNPSDADGLALFIASKNSVRKICWLGKGDILLIGRGKKK